MGELEEKENAPTDTTTSPQQEAVDEPKETDKMLEKKDDNELRTTTVVQSVKDKLPSPNTDKKKSSSSSPAASSSKPTTPTGEIIAADTKKTNGEEIINIIESSSKVDDSDEKKMSTEDREVKPKKIPIGGLKLPGFFMKSKPKADGGGDGADGELLEKENKDDCAGVGDGAGAGAATAATADGKSANDKPRASFGERLRNFFVRKPAAEKQAKQVANGDADAKSETTAEAAATEGTGVNGNNTTGTAGVEGAPQKRGLLNAIKLPIANMIPKKKSDEDVEMGMSKAGLASMETLDDSLKDQDCVDKAAVKNNGTEEEGKLKKAVSSEIKQASPDEKTPDEADDVPVSFCQRLFSYKLSADDCLIVFGVLMLIALISVMVIMSYNELVNRPHLRDGRFIEAVTGCGMVEGQKEDHSFVFRGIPYAQAPVGDLRWRPAKLIEGIDDCWNGTLQAHNVSAYCTQMLGNGTIIGDEDCLYLDVVTSHVRYDRLVPVIVLIGADTLTGPSPGLLRPSARYSRSHDVVFVRPNFRLGAFGFLALDVLTKDSYPHTSGNYGLSDIIAALKWVNLNIVNFGGDPKKVTLWGHRAGGTLVTALVTSKRIQDLYARAWVSSPSSIFPGKPLQESEKRNQEIMQALDCRDVACLREATTEQIWAATPDTWLHFPADIPTREENISSRHEWLVLDGHILQQHPADSWKQEKADGLTLVMGAVAHEAHTEKLRQRHKWTAEEVRAYIEASQIGALNLTDEAIKRYNATNYRGLVSMITDIRTICPLLTVARLQPSVPFYVVTRGDGTADDLATVDADVQAILGRYEPHLVEQRRFNSMMQSLFYVYSTRGSMSLYDPRRRVLNIDQDALPQEDYPNCNFWISNDIVPRYARVD